MSRWCLDWKREAESELADLDQSVRISVVNKLNWLVDNFDYIEPLSLHAKLADFFKLRIGDWRIVYKFDRNACVVTVFSIKHRSRAYKKRK